MSEDLGAPSSSPASAALPAEGPWIAPRVKRAAVGLAAVLISFGVYRVTVVPWIDLPRASLADTTEVPTVGRTLSARAAEVDGFFPEKYWRAAPNILENDPFKFLFSGYDNLPDGRVRFRKCAVLYCTAKPNESAAERRRRTLVLDAPDGAELLFDQPFRLGASELGRLVSARVPGQVLIRQEGRDPLRDRLWVKTSDFTLQYNAQSRLWELSSAQRVDFTFGESKGAAEGLLFELAPGNSAGSPATADANRTPPLPSIGGLQRITLKRLLGEGLELVPQGSGRMIGGPESATAQYPVKVKCDGSVEFVMSPPMVVFHRNVSVTRLAPSSAADQLECARLEVVLRDRRQATLTPAQLAKQPPTLTDLEPAAMVAHADPVSGTRLTVHSPSRKASVACHRLHYDLHSGWIQILGMPGMIPAEVRQEGSRAEVESLIYTPGAPGKLGTVKIEGRGWGHFVSTEKPRDTGADEKQQGLGPALGKAPSSLVAAWDGGLDLLPDGVDQLLTIRQGAKVATGDYRVEKDPRTGALQLFQTTVMPNGESRKLEAAQIELRFREVPPGSAKQNGGYAPKSLRAVRDEEGRELVCVDSEQFSAELDLLELFFKEAGQSKPGSLKVSGAPAGREGLILTAMVVPAAESSPGVRRLAPVTSASVSKYHLKAQWLQATLLAGQRQTDVEQLTVQGLDRLEQIAGPPGYRPVKIFGAALVAMAPMQPNGTIDIQGGPGRPAHFEGNGAALTGPRIWCDRGNKWVEVPGAGEMELPMERDLNGRPLTTPGTLRVEWQRRMTFNGLQAQFDDRVVASTAESCVQSQSMEVRLKMPIDFSTAGGLGSFAAARPAAPAEAIGAAGVGKDQQGLAYLACRGRVVVQNQAGPPEDPTSRERLWVNDLEIDNITGVMHAKGPGALRHVGKGSPKRPGTPALAVSLPGAQAGAAGGADDKLTAVLVDFEGPLEGNVRDGQRRIAFQGRTQCAQATVDSWEAQLDLNRPETLGPRSALLRSDQLILNEKVVAPGQTSTEVEAIGNALAEAPTYTARAARIAFDQLKDLVVLEGDGRTDAWLYRQQRVGAPLDQTSAQKILYYPSTNGVIIERGRSMNLFLQGK